MHNRQSGAAHVPIMFFLILLVMFLGALTFGYMTQTKNNELTKAAQEARAELRQLQLKDLLIEHYVADIGDVFKKPGEYSGRPRVDYQGQVFEYAGAMNPKQLKELLDTAANNAGVSQASSLENLFGAMIAKINSQAQRIKDVELARDTAITDKNQSDAKFSTVKSDADSRSRTNEQELEQARTDFDSAKTDKDRHIATLQASLNAKADELTSYKEEALAEQKRLEGRIALLKTQLSAMTEQIAMIQPPSVADGQVIVAENGIERAFINLGKKDMLPPGTVFRIKGRTDDGVKGYCQVTKVEDERAEVRLYDFVDPISDWARPGDRLFNDLYTPRMTRTIFLMGRFSAPYGHEQLANMLRRLGNKVVTRMGPGVDLVILGNDPVNEAGDGFAKVEESDEFKMANELRVEFAYLNKVADLIKL